MDQIESEVTAILRNVLGEAATRNLHADSALLGSVAEIDSMAVVAILTAVEERFGVCVDDDEVDGSTFATVASLIEFVRAKAMA
jgi:acyl carrier protein